MLENARQETSVEVAKRASDYLRGTLLEEMDNASPKFDGDSEQLLKFHGVYAQDNRDVRRERSLAGEELEHIFMTRVVVPGGFLTSEQWLRSTRLLTPSPMARFVSLRVRRFSTTAPSRADFSRWLVSSMKF